MNSAERFIGEKAITLAPLLDTDGTFLARDIDIDYSGEVLERCRKLGIVTSPGWTRVDTASGKTRGTRLRQYELNENYRELLATKLEQKQSGPTLPCGHPAHISNKEHGGFDCKYCEQERDYDRQTVKEAL